MPRRYSRSREARSCFVRFDDRASLVFLALACVLVVTLLGSLVPSAEALTQRPQWTVTAVSAPTNFAPNDQEGDQFYRITVTNTGGAASDGSPIIVTDMLPQGLALQPTAVGSGVDIKTGKTFECTYLTCVYDGTVIPDDQLSIVLPIDTEPGAPVEADNVVRVHGGGALDASIETPTNITTARSDFGFAPGSTTAALSSTQAGAHADLTTSLGFNTVKSDGVLAGDEKETVDDLPPGFAGDLVDTPSCSVALFSVKDCPISTQIGVTTLGIVLEDRQETFTTPVYNLTPAPGEVGKIGFLAKVFYVQGDITVRPDYGLRATFSNITETAAELDQATLTIWGVPGDPIHDPWRWNPSAKGGFGEFGISAASAVVPYLSNPTSCAGGFLQAHLVSRSWQEPERQIEDSVGFGELNDCDRLGFPASLIVQPTTTRASAPTGLNLELGVHQSYDNPEGLATSTLDKTVVSLPEGITVNPSSGAGLGACTLAQYEEEEKELVAGKGCPSDAKLGTVKITTPSLKEEATGTVYIAQPFDNPFDSLLALYVVARIPDRGILVKTAGKVEADPLTGHLVTTFDNLPPLPFSLFTFSFRQGETSPLVTPPTCGDFSVNAALTSLAQPTELLTVLSPEFSITSGFDGGLCPAGGAPPFDPQVTAGTSNNSAGAYSPMQIRITRNDGEQEITRFSAQLPPGLTANLSGVPFCPDANIEAARSRSGAEEEVSPSCPVASQIGSTLVGAGVGAVLAWTPGKVYMAGPYNGAPFSIVAITSAKVGPFDLGTVVVREALRIDPTTADVTVDAQASDPIPHIIDGIVVHVRDIRVYINRSNFSLNPTNCNSMTFTSIVSGAGTNFVSSADDVPVAVNDPFQVANCLNLKFKPDFKVSTSGVTSRRNGASLSVKLTYPNAPQGTQTNVRSVKVDLPKQLPSRLTTLQKACTSAVFASNPASCPVASRVGRARAVTPIIPVPLVGPAYFVSYGSAKFPELVIVLQGYGVTLNLHGETFISKKGITSSTFRTVPDAPIGSFELTLPEGPSSALAATAKLCGTKLKMPTAFTAQNGMKINQSTPIAVTNCPKHKAKKKRPVRRKGGKVSKKK